MVDPQRLPTADTCDDDATRPTGEPDPAATEVEPPRPPIGGSEAGDAVHPTGGPELTQPDVAPSLLRSAPLKYDVHHIPVDKVSDVEDRGIVNDEMATALAEAIERIGLQTPIMVRLQEMPDLETGEVPDAAYIVIVGRHRLAAYHKLGLPNIPAIVRDCSELEAELRMPAEKAADFPEEA